MRAAGNIVFRLEEDDVRFESLRIANNQDLERAAGEHLFRGAPIIDTWYPMAIEPMRDADNVAGEKRVGDCTVLYGTKPAFSAKAVDFLIDLLAPNGELLPMDFLGEPWFGFNVTTVVDVLDHDLSQIDFFPGTMRAVYVRRYAFVPAAIKHPIFKIPEYLSVTLVTEEFKNAVLAARLGGLAFKEVWRHGR